MEPNSSTSKGKKLWHMLRVMYYMLRKGITKHKLTTDFRSLLKGGKIAGKTIGNLLHNHDNNSSPAPGFRYSAFSCLSNHFMSFYNPGGREVEFSCSNTPNFHLTTTTKRKNRHHLKLDAAAVAKAFEILNSEIIDPLAVVSPSPMSISVSNLGKSPMRVRQLRITDSPFPIEGSPADGWVDNEAEDFIRRFYEQLQQQRISATPEYGRWVAGRA